jgi:hypothetical protein
MLAHRFYDDPTLPREAEVPEGLRALGRTAGTWRFDRCLQSIAVKAERPPRLAW